MCRFKGSFEISFGCRNRGRIVDIDGCDSSCRFGQRSGGLGTHRDIGYVIGELLGYFVVDILKITSSPSMSSEPLMSVLYLVISASGAEQCVL